MVMMTKWKARVRKLIAIVLIITRGRITLRAIALMTPLYTWHREARHLATPVFVPSLRGVPHLPPHVLKMALMTAFGKSEGNLVKSKNCVTYSRGFLVAWKGLMRVH